MSAQPDHTIISLFWLLLLPKALTDVRNISLPVSQMYKKKKKKEQIVVRHMQRLQKGLTANHGHSVLIYIYSVRLYTTYDVP